MTSSVASSWDFFPILGFFHRTSTTEDLKRSVVGHGRPRGQRGRRGGARGVRRRGHRALADREYSLSLSAEREYSLSLSAEAAEAAAMGMGSEEVVEKHCISVSAAY